MHTAQFELAAPLCKLSGRSDFLVYVVDPRAVGFTAKARMQPQVHLVVDPRSDRRLRFRGGYGIDLSGHRDDREQHHRRDQQGAHWPTLPVLVMNLPAVSGLPAHLMI
jgi:hypothetical protein